MKRIVPIGFVLFGFILLNIKVAECITCLSCHNVADLSNCKEAILCNANETCYIEKKLSPVDFKPVYNTGCKALEYCTLQLCNKKAYGDGFSRKKQANNDLTLCSECCFEDSCNVEGCGYKQPANNITQCFKCDEVFEGGPQCTTTEDCDLTLYACSVTNHPRSLQPGTYELGCKFKRAQCEVYVNLIGDQKDENVKCCDTTLCNPSPYNRKINKTVIEHDFKCPEGIIRPTTKPPLPPPTTTFPAPTKPSTSTVSPTFDSHTPTIASTSFSTSTPNVTQSSTPPPPTTTTSLPTTESTVQMTTTTTQPTTKSTVKTTTTTALPTTKSTVKTTTTTTQPTTKSTVKTTTTTTKPTTKSTVPTTTSTTQPSTKSTNKTTTTTQPTTKSTVKTTTTTTQPTSKSTVKTTTTTTIPTTKSTVPTTTTTTIPTTKSTVPTTTTTTIPTTKSTVPTTTTTTLPTTKTTTPVPTTKTTTTLAASTGVPPKTIPPVTTMCAVCSGPKFLCEKLFAPTRCAPPNNYCINSITNHLDGTKTVERSCGNFDTCYREWFEGSSDDDKCRDFDGNDQQFLDFHCTFCCTTDNCNTPLHPSQDSLYKPV